MSPKPRAARSVVLREGRKRDAHTAALAEEPDLPSVVEASGERSDVLVRLPRDGDAIRRVGGCDGVSHWHVPRELQD